MAAQALVVVAELHDFLLLPFQESMLITIYFKHYNIRNNSMRIKFKRASPVPEKST